ncbi:MAG: hypothetical protein HY059_05120 [Proteobacteria bacterium]|nr:hypothetical protein [Pseudomonadota bacterium]
MDTEVEVRNVINLTGRGAVLVAFARGKLPTAGQLTPPLVFGGAAPRALEVRSVEKLTAMEVGGVAIGLVFKQPPSVADLKRALPPGGRLLLEDAPAR